jgi:hypothetical protein
MCPLPLVLTGHLMVANVVACIKIAVELPGAGTKPKPDHVATCGELDTMMIS